MKTMKRKKRSKNANKRPCYVVESCGKAELMLMAFCLEATIRELNKHVADISQRLQNTQMHLRAFEEKLRYVELPNHPTEG